MKKKKKQRQGLCLQEYINELDRVYIRGFYSVKYQI